jgi:hypothetical protein
MLELLNSNFEPLKTESNKFPDVFFGLFERSSSVRIASGYVSEESIDEIIKLYEERYIKPLHLIVGMHYFEGFSYRQYHALLRLAKILTDKNAGGVYISTKMKYHGKVYSFCENGRYSAIIGSSNLTKIADKAKLVYDTDVYIHDEEIVNDIEKFIVDLQDKFCTNLKDIKRDDIKINVPENLFGDYPSVEKVATGGIEDQLTDIVFDLPLKTEEKSNLNAYLGKGRPRDWYEVEIIVPKKLRSKKGYPKKERFWVITDDGYKFECKTNGDDSKNFRSTPELKILGLWIKGRLEERCVLKHGEKATDETLEKYGRKDLQLTKTKMKNTWYLDFGIHN